MLGGTCPSFFCSDPPAVWRWVGVEKNTWCLWCPARTASSAVNNYGEVSKSSTDARNHLYPDHCALMGDCHRRLDAGARFLSASTRVLPLSTAVNLPLKLLASAISFLYRSQVRRFFLCWLTKLFLSSCWQFVGLPVAQPSSVGATIRSLPR